MIQVIAAGAKALKTAAKAAKTAKKAKAAGARAAKAGDKFYNARRRYQRAAERNLRKAEASSGATAARYRSLAMQDLDKALSTYDKATTQEFSKPIQNLADKLGVDLSQQRRQLQARKDDSAKRLRTLAEQDSTQRLESVLKDPETRRQAEAKAVFSSDIGSRIIGGLVDVWRPVAVEAGKVNKGKMMQAIYNYFNVDNLADLLQSVEDQLGESLYKDGDMDSVYETVKLTIQNKVASNTLVA